MDLIKRINFYIAHILLIAGISLILFGLLASPPPMVVERADLIENETYTDEEIGEIIDEYGVENGINELPDNINSEPPTISFDSYDNETQKNFKELISGEQDSFTSSNVETSGEFYVEKEDNDDEKLYYFKGEPEYTNPLFLSITGFFMFLISIIYIYTNEGLYQTELPSKFDEKGLYKDHSDSEWDFYTTDEDDNNSKVKENQ